MTIEVHEPYLSPQLARLISMERGRRQSKHIEISVEELEKSYFGIEVGNERRFFNAFLNAAIPNGCKTLLDYGCGGGWWKEHWGSVEYITAVDVAQSHLESVRRAFPDAARVRLIYAPNGITELPDSSYDCVVSSSVVGYIHPDLARVHVREISRLVKPGGIAIFTRVNAANYATVKRGQLIETNGGWAYRYRQSEFHALLAEAGLEVVKAKRMGIHIPFARKFVQWAYSYRAFQGLDSLVNRLPGVAVHHFAVARRRAIHQ